MDNLLVENRAAKMLENRAGNRQNQRNMKNCRQAQAPSALAKALRPA